jgi:hypothetical protein
MQGFISYAHYDRKAFVRLSAHLAHVALAFDFALWSDERIHAGDYWSKRIEEEIERSEIFVLAVTNDFLGSSYIWNHELPAILNRHKSANALIIPVILRPSSWKGLLGGYIQALPSYRGGDIRPVLDWPRPENGYAAAASGVADAVADWFGVSPKTPFDVLKPTARP